jgi:hypothetical protein
MDSRLRENDNAPVIPAQAGIHFKPELLNNLTATAIPATLQLQQPFPEFACSAA